MEGTSILSPENHWTRKRPRRVGGGNAMGRRRCGDVDLDVETQLDKTGYLQERLFALPHTLCVAVKGPEQAALLDRPNDDIAAPRRKLSPIP